MYFHAANRLAILIENLAGDFPACADAKVDAGHVLSRREGDRARDRWHHCLEASRGHADNAGRNAPKCVVAGVVRRCFDSFGTARSAHCRARYGQAGPCVQ